VERSDTHRALDDQRRHYEERNDEAIQTSSVFLDCFACARNDDRWDHLLMIAGTVVDTVRG
jgi:hypothetical protein